MQKPILAISMGDPAGIGPEIICANLDLLLDKAPVVLFGHWPTFQLSLKKQEKRMGIELLDGVDKPIEKKLYFRHTGPDCPPITEVGLDAGISQFKALEAATDAVLAGQCDSLVTAPVSKELIAKIDGEFSGHTEYLAKKSGLHSDDVTMVFASNELIVGMIATHVPLSQVPQTITKKRYLRTLKHVKQLVQQFKPDHVPRIAIAALNPHGGEGGLLGSQELEIIEPFCQEARCQKDLRLIGPSPADTVFKDAFSGKYDAVIAAYHDQAMIPIKLGGPGTMVNITMGLPFIRTSPDHGVAYDIARTNQADASGFRLAIELATKLFVMR